MINDNKLDGNYIINLNNYYIKIMCVFLWGSTIKKLLFFHVNIIFTFYFFLKMIMQQLPYLKYFLFLFFVL